MALSERNHLYEILVRVQGDGTWAAHQRYISEIVDDATGEVRSAIPGEPTTLVSGDVQSILGPVISGLAAERDSAVGDLSAALVIIDSRDLAITAANDALAGKDSEIAALQDTVAQKDVDLAAAQAQVVTLQAQIDLLSPA